MSTLALLRLHEEQEHRTHEEIGKEAAREQVLNNEQGSWNDEMPRARASIHPSALFVPTRDR